MEGQASETAILLRSLLCLVPLDHNENWSSLNIGISIRNASMYVATIFILPFKAIDFWLQH